MRPLLAGAGIVIAVAIAAGESPFRAQGTTTQAPEPGTYRVVLCAEACTPENLARTIGVATVVILEGAAAAAEPAREVFATLPAIRQSRERDRVPADNVCFKVTEHERRVGAEELLFGITPRGTSRWSFAAADGFSLRVFASIDAVYALRWTTPGRLTQGEGWSSLAPEIPYHRNAYFSATRLGAPDTAQCK